MLLGIPKFFCELADIRHNQGHLFRSMEGLFFVLKRGAGLITLTNDIVKTQINEPALGSVNKLRSPTNKRQYPMVSKQPAGIALSVFE
jgi:hypothetical protein